MCYCPSPGCQLSSKHKHWSTPSYIIMAPRFMRHVSSSVVKLNKVRIQKQFLLVQLEILQKWDWWPANTAVVFTDMWSLWYWYGSFRVLVKTLQIPYKLDMKHPHASQTNMCTLKLNQSFSHMVQNYKFALHRHLNPTPTSLRHLVHIKSFLIGHRDASQI